MLLPKLSARTRELKAVETTVINLTIMIPLERGGAIVAARPNGGESTGPEYECAMWGPKPETRTYPLVLFFTVFVLI